VNNLRRQCFGEKIELRVAKNTLIRKALEANTQSDFAELIPVLHGETAIMFCEVAKAPAKLIKSFREKNDKPILKAAFVQSTIFVGDNQLDTLNTLKTKNELIGDILGLLMSPMQNVLGGLQSGGNNLHGLLKAIEERNSAQS